MLNNIVQWDPPYKNNNCMIELSSDVGEICWWKKSMLVKNFLYVGEAVCWWRQKFICMLVKYVSENFSVCWWKLLYVGEQFVQKF